MLTVLTILAILATNVYETLKGMIKVKCNITLRGSMSVSKQLHTYPS